MEQMTTMPSQTKQQPQLAVIEETNLEFQAAKLEAVKAGLEEITNNQNPIWLSSVDMDTWFDAQRQPT